MHQRCTLLLLILALTAPDPDDAGLIYGGKVAVPHSRPYMVLVERKLPSGKTSICGGFLLSKNFVMTAAHCQASSYNVILGLHDYSKQDNTERIPVKETFIREDYVPETLINDLLLLKLSYDAKLSSHVGPIALAAPEAAAPQSCSVAGWGRSDKHPTSMTPVLMEVDITLSADCEDKDFYCFLGSAGVGRGDSGGPLVCEDGKAYGVASGTVEKEKEKENLFSKIPKHKEWIDSIMNTV
uniref:trypsin n=1 Tax=Neogobius melanostomus TaxID=47308 RepID=A0A8C6WKY3_9GOBI